MITSAESNEKEYVGRSLFAYTTYVRIGVGDMEIFSRIESGGEIKGYLLTKLKKDAIIILQKIKAGG